MNFGEIIVAVVVGWILGVIPTWLILARTLPWLDVKMLPKSKPVTQQPSIPPTGGSVLSGSGQSLPATQELTA